MSEHPANPTAGSASRPPVTPPTTEAAAPRPARAPLVSILGVLALFALFLVVVIYVYLPRQTGAFSDDGIRTEAQRRKALAELREKEAQQLASYAWIDQKAGVVQLPLDRAMELTLQKYQPPTR